jgi:hypothetical protein
MSAAAKSIAARPGRSPGRFPAPILALPTGVPTKPRVTPDRNERRIANGAELENKHCFHGPGWASPICNDRERAGRGQFRLFTALSAHPPPRSRLLADAALRALAQPYCSRLFERAWPPLASPPQTALTRADPAAPTDRRSFRFFRIASPRNLQPPKRNWPRAGRMRAIDFCRCSPAVEPYRGGRTFFPGRQPSLRKALSLEARNYTATIL